MINQHKLILGVNWKMSLTLKQAQEITLYIKNLPIDYSKIEIILYPSILHIYPISTILEDTNIKIGAQNIHYVDQGAYTGETGVYMIKELGCSHVLLGHSERRHYFLEDYNFVNQKMHIALKSGLNVMLCIGESTEEHRTQISEMAVIDQLVSAFQNIKRNMIKENSIIITYEPIWAIGTGKTNSVEDILYISSIIQKTLVKLYNTKIANQIPIIYGGSINAKNVYTILEKTNIKGVLVGKSTLDKNIFFALLKKMNVLQ